MVESKALRPSDRLRQHRLEVLRLIREHGASDARVVGSVARGEDTPSSDLDLLVKVEPDQAWEFVTLASDLGELLGVPVDVLSEGGLKASHAPMLADAVPL